MINIDDFHKLELKVGTVLSAEEIEGSEKLIKLQIDLGEENPRQVLTGMKMWYTPEEFVGKQLVIIANLEPRMMMGFESQGMVLAAEGEDKPILLHPSQNVKPGSGIK